MHKNRAPLLTSHHIIRDNYNEFLGSTKVHGILSLIKYAVENSVNVLNNTNFPVIKVKIKTYKEKPDNISITVKDNGSGCYGDMGSKLNPLDPTKESTDVGSMKIPHTDSNVGGLYIINACSSRLEIRTKTGIDHERQYKFTDGFNEVNRIFRYNELDKSPGTTIVFSPDLRMLKDDLINIFNMRVMIKSYLKGIIDKNNDIELHYTWNSENTIILNKRRKVK